VRRPHSLRRTLIVAIVALIAVLTLAIGVFSTVALRGGLVERLDSQLITATDRSFDRFGPGGEERQPPRDAAQDGEEDPAAGGGGENEPPRGSQVLDMPGQREGTIAGTISGSTVTSAQVITETGTLRSITDDELAALHDTAVDGVPRTVTIGDLGSYRVIARSADDGSGEALLMGLPLAETEATVLQLTLLIGIAGLTGVALAVLAGTLIVRLALRPLDRIAETATTVSQLRLDQGEVALPMRVEQRDADPATEVGQVGEALNTLLAHVADALAARQVSEEKLRRFVADASHELRTPLASIRGYAELTGRSPESLPEGAAHAIARIEAESIRMTRLVEDLLLLARLDEGERVGNAPVDLTQQLSDAVSDARVAGPDHRWHLILPPEPVIVTGDGMRLHQVTVNLLGNARVHTPAATEITASVRAEGDTAVLEVRDDGPGIEESIASTLFERFVRGDTARSRKTGSTGLGLAIASAIVEAHGGKLSVMSAPGDTVFTVRLPLRA